MLTSALRVLIKNPIKENFDITFIGNEKICQNITFIGNEKTCQNINFFFLFLSKLSLNRFLTSALRALVSMTLILLAKTSV